MRTARFTAQYEYKSLFLIMPFLIFRTIVGKFPLFYLTKLFEYPTFDSILLPADDDAVFCGAAAHDRRFCVVEYFPASRPGMQPAAARVEASCGASIQVVMNPSFQPAPCSYGRTFSSIYATTPRRRVSRQVDYRCA